jgi:hypothetical protein
LIVPAGAKTATFSVMANRIPGRSVAINIRARTGAVEKSVRLTIVRH